MQIERHANSGLGSAAGWVLYLGALSLIAVLLPASAFDARHTHYWVALGSIGVWRYSLGAVHFARAMLFLHWRFPRLRRAASAQDQGTDGAPPIYLLITSYRIDTATSAKVYRAALREATGEAKGRIRVSAARTFGDAELGLSLVDFAKAYPDIGLDIHLDDNFVNLVEEGFDVAIRMTRLNDSAMIARRLASLDFAIVASPELLARLGRPSHPSEFVDYPAVVDSNSRMFSNWMFRDPVSQEQISVAVSGQFTANSPVTVRAAALAGLGFALSPSFVVRDDLEAGRLVTVLDEYMTSDAGIYAVFPHRRHLPARVRVFVDYLAEWFKKCNRKVAGELANGQGADAAARPDQMA